MKKKSAKQRIRISRLSRKRFKRSKESKKKTKSINRIKSEYLESPSKHVPSRYQLAGPKHLAITDNRANRGALLQWLKNLRTITLKYNRPVFIDYSTSSGAEAFAFLLMLAEIDRIQNIKGQKYVTGCEPINNITAQVFHQVGLAKMINIKDKKEITSERVVCWHHVHGTKIEADNAGRLIVKIANKYGLSGQIAEMLYDGVVEAITNTVMHAYTGKRNDGYKYGDNKWWMFAGVKNDELIVVVCDIGIGIPRSLKEEHPIFHKKFKNLCSSGKDSNLIKVALEKGRSHTRKPHRGLGMAEMKKFIEIVGWGELVIMSNKGVYLYSGGNYSESTWNHQSSILGTIVGWKIPLNILRSSEQCAHED